MIPLTDGADDCVGALVHVVGVVLFPPPTGVVTVRLSRSGNSGPGSRRAALHSRERARAPSTSGSISLSLDVEELLSEPDKVDVLHIR